MVQEVTQRHGRLYYPAKDGRLFHAATAVSGVAPGTTLSTTAGFALYNPHDSDVDLAIQKVVAGYISGTLGAGTIFHLANPIAVSATPSGTAIAEQAARLGGSPPKGVALTTATIVAPTIIRPFASLGASLATTAVQPWQVWEDVDGAIVVPPGTLYALHAAAAGGTSPLIAYGVTWEEIPAGVA
jgi:hypothetical protein